MKMFLLKTKSLFSIIFILAGGYYLAFAQTVSSNETLAIGKAINKELKGGEKHQYTIQASRDHYLKVLVEQRGINVVVTLFTPDGNKAIEIDSPTGKVGTETLSFIAQTEGKFVLEVKSLEKNAEQGSYQVKLDQLRISTQKDRDQIKAEQYFLEAEKWKIQPTLESIQKAIPNYIEAEKFYRLAEDQAGEATTLSNFGELYYAIGNYETAIANFKKALTLFQTLKSKSGEASNLSNLGACYSALGDNEKAVEYYSPAVIVFQELNDEQSEATVSGNLGKTYNDLGRTQEALTALERSLFLCRKVVNKRCEGISLNNLGAVYDLLGDYQKSLDVYLKVLPIFREVKERTGEGIVLSNIGSAYRGLGELQNAIEFYNQSLPILKEINDKRSQAYVHSNLGESYAIVSTPDNALREYEEALKLFQEIGDVRGEAHVLSNVGILYYSLDENKKASEYFLQSLPIRKKASDRGGEARNLYYLGQNYIDLKDLPNAERNLLDGLKLAREIGDKDTEARSLYSLADLENKKDDLSKALIYIEQAIEIVEKNRSQITNADLRVSYFALFQDYYQLYIQILMESHQKSPEMKFNEMAFKISERSRSRSLAELLSESRIDIKQGVDTKLVGKEKSLQQRISAVAEKLFRSPSSLSDQRTSLEKEFLALKIELQQVSANIKSQSPQYAALSQPQTLTLSEVQNLLDDNTLLLEFSLGEKQSYLWVVGKKEFAGSVIPSKTDIEKNAKNVYDLLIARQPKPNESRDQHKERIAKADQDYPQAANELSQMLFGSIYSKLGNKRLLIIADGALQYIPFSALPVPKSKSSANQMTPLVVNHEIVTLPSASILSVLRTNQRDYKQLKNKIITFADPVFDPEDSRVKNISVKETPNPDKPKPNDPNKTRSSESLRSFFNDRDGLRRLIFSRDEVNNIAALAPTGDSKSFLDFNANLSEVLSAEYGNYRYVHFATHGILDSQRPELSGIVFSLIDEKGNSQSGFLGLSDVYNLKLPVDMVVLSACQTGLGKDVRGEGLIGLTRGFMYAGANRVVASLWSVNDNSTSQLMKRMYQKILKQGVPPTAALRQSQIEMWKKKQNNHPYYWAGFTIQGDYK